MNTLILKATGTIENPKYGKIIDLDDGLIFELDASKLNLSNGAEVSSWSSTNGYGSAAERVFNYKYSSYGYPTYSTANKSVEFNGSQMLMNTNNDVTFVRDTTYIVVFRVDDYSSATSRILSGGVSDTGSGGSSDQYQSIQPAGTGFIRMRTGKFDDSDTGSVNGTTIATTAGWNVGVFVFSGTESKHLMNDVIVSQSLASGAQDEIAIGASPSSLTANGGALIGGIRYVAQYSRALSDAEMILAAEYAASIFS